MKFALWVFAGFVLTEAFSYVLHRWVFHGVLWRIHRTHHLAGRGRLELNDVFSIFFSGVAVVIMVAADSVWDSVAFPLGTGITLYGTLYFIAHDAYTHRRLFGFQTNWRWLNAIRSAHRHHHQDVTRDGQEPYGLFWFRGYKEATARRRAGRASGSAARGVG